MTTEQSTKPSDILVARQEIQKILGVASDNRKLAEIMQVVNDLVQDEVSRSYDWGFQDGYDEAKYG